MKPAAVIFPSQNMNCPCYCAIYESACHIPAAIAAIITEYCHTYSDWDIVNIFKSYSVRMMKTIMRGAAAQKNTCIFYLMPTRANHRRSIQNSSPGNAPP